jgi:hypothetical protein
MAAKLIISPEAEQDIGDAYCWYEDRRPGLGEEFLSCVDACIQRVCRVLELHAKAHEEYRRALSVCGFLRVCRWDCDGLLRLPHIPGSREVAPAVVVNTWMRIRQLEDHHACQQVCGRVRRMSGSGPSRVSGGGFDGFGIAAG